MESDLTNNNNKKKKNNKKTKVFNVVYHSLVDFQLFSSPEPKAPGELIGCRPNTISNDFSETTGPVVTKLHM